MAAPLSVPLDALEGSSEQETTSSSELAVSDSKCDFVHSLRVDLLSFLRLDPGDRAVLLLPRRLRGSRCRDLRDRREADESLPPSPPEMPVEAVRSVL